MSVVPRVRVTIVAAGLVAGLFAIAGDVRAQANVGTGPLTGSLAETEPTAGVLSLGPVKLAPGIVIREIGYDSNVFDEPESQSPKDDYLMALQPDISAFTRLRFLKVSAYAGADLNYFRTYKTENSAGHVLRGRVDLLLSRMRPFVAGGETSVRTRPNGEIDVRADRKDHELSGGFAFDLSEHSLFYVAAARTSNAFEDAFEDGVNIGETMTREGNDYSGGIRTDLTPLLSLTLFGGYHEDLFTEVPIRNTESYYGTAQFGFAPEGVVNGSASVSYRNMTPVDPTVAPFSGVVGSLGLSYSLLEKGRFSLGLGRSLEYSFDTTEAYYVENSVSLVYTHRLFGRVDAQGRGSRSLFVYNASSASPAHDDTLDSWAAGVGYNLPNRTRVAVNYEFSRRRAPAIPDRNYERRRVYLSWLFAF